MNTTSRPYSVRPNFRWKLLISALALNLAIAWSAPSVNAEPGPGVATASRGVAATRMLLNKHFSGQVQSFRRIATRSATNTYRVTLKDGTTHERLVHNQKEQVKKMPPSKRVVAKGKAAPTTKRRGAKAVSETTPAVETEPLVAPEGESALSETPGETESLASASPETSLEALDRISGLAGQGSKRRALHRAKSALHDGSASGYEYQQETFPRVLASIDAQEKEGILTAEQANEIRQQIKDSTLSKSDYHLMQEYLGPRVGNHRVRDKLFAWIPGTDARAQRVLNKELLKTASQLRKQGPDGHMQARLLLADAKHRGLTRGYSPRAIRFRLERAKLARNIDGEIKRAAEDGDPMGLQMAWDLKTSLKQDVDSSYTPSEKEIKNIDAKRRQAKVTLAKKLGEFANWIELHPEKADELFKSAKALFEQAGYEGFNSESMADDMRKTAIDLKKELESDGGLSRKERHALRHVEKPAGFVERAALGTAKFAFNKGKALATLPVKLPLSIVTYVNDQFGPMAQWRGLTGKQHQYIAEKKYKQQMKKLEKKTGMNPGEVIYDQFRYLSRELPADRNTLSALFNPAYAAHFAQQLQNQAGQSNQPLLPSPAMLSR